MKTFLGFIMGVFIGVIGFATLQVYGINKGNRQVIDLFEFMYENHD